MKPTMAVSTSPSPMVSRPILSRKRYLMLFLFCIFSASNAFQWIQYSIISNIIADYYKVSIMAVNWTSVIYMALYVPGILPASWLLDKFGLRVCIILGCFGTTLGSWIKVFSVHRDAFWITMAGQTVVALSQLFVLNIPPRLAAVWFGENEVSRATAFGVTCNNLGIAIGFLIPPFVVPSPTVVLTPDDIDGGKIAVVNKAAGATVVTTVNGGSIQSISGLTSQVINDVDSMNEVAFGLNILFISMALITLLTFVAILIFFDDKPPHPPSAAMAAAIEMESNEATSFTDSIKALFGSKNFVLLLLSYGLNVGVFYAISTVLNQLISLSFPGHEKDAGLMGLIMTLSGIFGSTIGGYILDATKKYKETTLVVYILSLLGMILFSICLRVNVNIWPLYFFSGFLGFFMTGYLPIGFELGAEISYPSPEGTSAGLLNAAAQVFGIIFTFSSSSLIDTYGDVPAMTFLSSALVIGTVLTIMIKSDLRRQNASAASNAVRRNSLAMNGIITTKPPPPIMVQLPDRLV